MSNGLDPDQDRHTVGSDLGPNCLQRFSADVKHHSSKEELTLYLIEPPFKAFANRADPDQAALVRAA